jgi:hypothetical protein
MVRLLLQAERQLLFLPELAGAAAGLHGVPLFELASLRSGNASRASGGNDARVCFLEVGDSEESVAYAKAALPLHR